jgi:hypothetical protein
MLQHQPDGSEIKTFDGRSSDTTKSKVQKAVPLKRTFQRVQVFADGDAVKLD